MRKNMKRKTNVKSSIMVLMLIAILLIASTYAWFTSNRTVTISSIDVNVAASSGIQISVDGIQWKTVITGEDLIAANEHTTYSGAINQIPTGTGASELAPVSTAGNMTNGKLDMFYGVVEADNAGVYKLTATQETDTAGRVGHYIAFDVFVKVDQASDIYLTDSSDVVVPSSSSDKGIKNAARVAFCVLGHSNNLNDTTGAAYQSLADANPRVIIWEPNYDDHKDSAITHAYQNYGTTITSSTAKLDYYGINEAISTAQVLSATTHMTQMSSDLATKAGRQALLSREGTTAGTFPYTQGTLKVQNDPMQAGVSKVRIYMWIEGQDLDCENLASGTAVRFDLGFTLDPTAANLPS